MPVPSPPEQMVRHTTGARHDLKVNRSLDYLWGHLSDEPYLRLGFEVKF